MKSLDSELLWNPVLLHRHIDHPMFLTFQELYLPLTPRDPYRGPHWKSWEYFGIEFLRYWFRVWYVLYILPMTRNPAFGFRGRATTWDSTLYFLATYDAAIVLLYYGLCHFGIGIGFIVGRAATPTLSEWLEICLIFGGLLGSYLASEYAGRRSLEIINAIHSVSLTCMYAIMILSRK